MGERDFIVCRTSHMRGFVSSFQGRVAALPSDLRSAAKAVLRRDGVAGLLRTVSGDGDPVIAELAERNLKRRQIRFRAVFSNPLVAFFYRRATRIQCRLIAAAFAGWLDENPKALVVVFNGYLMPDSILAAVSPRCNAIRTASTIRAPCRAMPTSIVPSTPPNWAKSPPHWSNASRN